jgi:hypothetical protein
MGYPQFADENWDLRGEEATWSLWGRGQAKTGIQVSGPVPGLKGAAGGCSLNPGSLQMTVPTSGSGAHCCGTSRMAPCPCLSGSSVRRSGADFG